MNLSKSLFAEFFGTAWLVFGGCGAAVLAAGFPGLGIGFVSRWAISKELELGALKVAEVAGLKVDRHFTLISRTGPEPQGPAAAFRTFALERARLLVSTPRKPSRSTKSRR